MAKGPFARIVPVLALLLVLGGGAFFFLVRSLDSLVRAGIERTGPRVTGTSVDVGRVQLKLREGRGEFRDLRIGNPDGFSGDDALQLGEIVLDLDTDRLAKEPYVIDEIRVATSTLRLELNERGGSNLERIREHIQAYAPVAAQDGGRPAPRIIVRKLTFEGAVVQVDARAIGGKESQVEIGAVELTDLGGAEGLPADEVAQAALQKLVREVTRKAAGEALTGRLKDAAERSVGEKAADALGGLLDR